MTKRRFDAVLGAAIALAALALYVWGIPAWVEANDFTAVSPNLLPRTCVALIGGLGALMTVDRLLVNRGDDAHMAFEWRTVGLVAGVVALLALSVTLMLLVGYLAGGAALVAALMLLMDARPRWLIPVVAVLAPLALYGLFDKVLGVPMP